MDFVNILRTKPIPILVRRPDFMIVRPFVSVFETKFTHDHGRWEGTAASIEVRFTV